MFRLESNRDGFGLTISRTDRPDLYDAALDCGPMTAVGQFYEPDTSGLGDFFTELAEEWRGWEGDKSWASAEGEITFTASHDRLGIVAIGVQLHSEVYRERDWLWNAGAILCVDPGSLGRLARRAHDAF